MFGKLLRIVQVGKLSRLGVKDVSISLKRTSATHAKWYYRTSKPVKDIALYPKVASVAVGTIMWYYILWHVYYDSAKLVGHFPVPDPTQWTDEELGIPPEDE